MSSPSIPRTCDICEVIAQHLQVRSENSTHPEDRVEALPKPGHSRDANEQDCDPCGHTGSFRGRGEHEGLVGEE